MLFWSLQLKSSTRKNKKLKLWISAYQVLNIKKSRGGGVVTAIQGANNLFHSHIIEILFLFISISIYFYPVYCTTHSQDSISSCHSCFSCVMCLCVCVQSLSHVQPHGLQHSRLPCPSLSPRICSNSCPLSRWCYLTISFSTRLFSFCLQSFPFLDHSLVMEKRLV